MKKNWKLSHNPFHPLLPDQERKKATKKLKNQSRNKHCWRSLMMWTTSEKKPRRIRGWRTTWGCRVDDFVIGGDGENKGVEFPKKRSWGLERSMLVHQNHLLHQPRRPGEWKRHRFLRWCLHLQNLAFVGFLGARNCDTDGGEVCRGMGGQATGGDDTCEWVSRLELGKKSEFGLSYHFLLIGCLETQSIRVVKSEALECWNSKHWSGKRKPGRFYKSCLWTNGFVQPSWILCHKIVLMY